MARPVALKWPVTLSWGVRRARYVAGYHTGTDFGVPIGTPVKSPKKCVVLGTYFNNSAYGNYVVLKDNRKGKYLVYYLCHLSKISVKTGQSLKKGQQVGLSGASGNVIGAHLHAEERVPPYGYYNTHKPTAWLRG